MWHVLALAAAAMLLPSATLKAQEAVKVGVCNPAKVFEQMDERKVIEDKMKSERDKAQAEVARRKNEVEDIQRQRNELRPESAIFQEKTNQMMEKAVQFEVWARMKEAEMGRTEKEQIKTLYEKIRDSCKEVATEKKLDLILAERKPELPPNMEKLTADQVRDFETLLSTQGFVPRPLDDLLAELPQTVAQIATAIREEAEPVLHPPPA
jgi:Skp family chaperone for outer membrane proteins